MKQKIVQRYVDRGFGFPVVLRDVRLVHVRGQWTPHINHRKLAEAVARELAFKPSRLTGNETRFLRQHLGMTLQSFAKRFYVTHPAVMKWERRGDKHTGMHWATEKDIRLQVLESRKASPGTLARLYRLLEHAGDGRAAPLVVGRRTAA